MADDEMRRTGVGGDGVLRGQGSAVTRRRFARGAGAALALAALGGDRNKAAGQEVTPASGATRRVTDLTGREVEVPAAPQRVVALDPNRTIVNLVELGIVPVGATTNDSNPAGGFSPVIAEVAGRIESVGVTGSASLETLATLRPDLIFFATNYQDLPIARLEDIAPTVTYEAPATSIAEHLAFVGEVVGRRDEARRVADAFAATVAARRETLGLDGRRVGCCGFVNYEAGGTFYIPDPAGAIGTMLTDLGAVIVPEAVDGQPVTDFVQDLSLEVIGDLLADAEVVVATRYLGTEEMEMAFTAMAESPLWQRVPAVARGDVAILDTQPANGNWGVRGLGIALDDLAAQLGKTDGR